MLFVSLRIENYAQALIPHLKVYKSEELIYNEAVSMLFRRDTAKKCRIKTRVEMINNRIKGVLCMRKQFNKMTAKLGAITIVSLALITGCSSSPGSANNTTSQTATEMESSAATQEPLVVDSQSETGVSEQTSSLDKEVVSFETYFDLLGTGKQDFIDKMNEKPNAIDEGGLEFEKAGIRVWFQRNAGTVSQIFLQANQVDFNGARIGDKIDKFKTAFGEPVSDKNGDMHFKYKTGFVSVNYDTQTDDTVAVYLLAEDF